MKVHYLWGAAQATLRIMQRRGYTIDEVNAYYDSLQKWAEPVHSMDPLIEFFPEIKSIESESEEPLTEEFDAVLSSFKAVNSVILPFFNLNRRIMTQIHRMEDWGRQCQSCGQNRCFGKA